MLAASLLTNAASWPFLRILLCRETGGRGSTRSRQKRNSPHFATASAAACRMAMINGPEAVPFVLVSKPRLARGRAQKKRPDPFFSLCFSSDPQCDISIWANPVTFLSWSDTFSSYFDKPASVCSDYPHVRDREER